MRIALQQDDDASEDMSMTRAIDPPTFAPRTTPRAAAGLCRVSFAVAVAATIALAGAGCSQAGDSAASIVRAPIRGTAELTGFATTPPEAKDFVKQTRNPDADFMPVGVTPPARSIRAKTPDEIKAMESDLDSTLQRHNAVSGRSATGDKFKSAASAQKPAAAPRGSDRFLIPPKPKVTPAPAGTKPSSGDQTKS